MTTRGIAATRRSGGPVAPALILHSAVYKPTTDWYLPKIYGNLHARQEWENFAPVMVGDTLRAHRMIVERYLKRDREYVVCEVIVTNSAGLIVSRSRTHQSFLLETQTNEGFAVDKSREKDPSRNFNIGEQRRRGLRGAGAQPHRGDVLRVLGSGAQLPQRSRQGDRTRLPGNRRAGDALGLHGLRDDDAPLRARMVLWRQDGPAPGQRGVGQRCDRTARLDHRAARRRTAYAGRGGGVVRQVRRHEDHRRQRERIRAYKSSIRGLLESERYIL